MNTNLGLEETVFTLSFEQISTERKEVLLLFMFGGQMFSLDMFIWYPVVCLMGLFHPPCSLHLCPFHGSALPQRCFYTLFAENKFPQCTIIDPRTAVPSCVLTVYNSLHILTC